MSDFDELLAEYTSKGNAEVHGALFKVVDKNGKQIYSKIAGYDSLSEDASPLKEDAVFKGASMTKLITSIALLQCIEKGLIGLDEPLDKILPELTNKEILTGESDGKLITKLSTKKVTARHLLTHTSGLGYAMMHPLLTKWAETEQGKQAASSQITAEYFNYPLIFEPGEGWLYGPSIDWAGIVVRRLNGNMSLEEYFIENIWEPLGLVAPFPTFHLSAHPEYAARLQQAGERAPDGGLKPGLLDFGDNAVDQTGGDGLCFTAADYLAVLKDIISDTPKLLKADTVDQMFAPQLAEDSPPISMMRELNLGMGLLGGRDLDKHMNHGLAGAIAGGVPENYQPKKVLGWAGATNPVWFASRVAGVAGLFATQIAPFADSAVINLVQAWKKDFWGNYYECGEW
ncbi:beta-lactamase/transpeptidase-like protein [Microthyrium microscopicum]|uniref:Beta-lactamase/transpeptidase-like protein n=1 Tax=Microthyrium microscopicum TaxID=703497 RepID=A0A6A6UTJ0_9PEZI|nr:beta-lactamase/transpeptidase-like protein [Microthyrium microscopicum]